MTYTSQEAAQLIERDISTYYYWKKKYQGYIEMTGSGRKARITETGILQIKLIAELSNKGKSFAEIVELLKERYPIENGVFKAIEITTPVTEDIIRKVIKELVLPKIANLQSTLDMVLKDKLDSLSEGTAETLNVQSKQEMEEIEDFVEGIEITPEVTPEKPVEKDSTEIPKEEILEIMLSLKKKFPKPTDAQHKIDAMNKTGIPANKKDGLWTVKNFSDKFRYLEKTL